MSLINDMLKNIERRQLSNNKTSHWGNELKMDYEEETIFTKAVLTALIMCAIIALATAGYYWYHHRHAETAKTKKIAASKIVPLTAAYAATSASVPLSSSPSSNINITQPPVQANNAVPLAQSATDNLPPPPKIISGISFNDLANQLEINLNFTDSPTYLVNYEASSNTLKLTLQNVYLEQDKLCQKLNKPDGCIVNKLIPMPISSSALSSISVEQNDGQALVLDFHLGQGASFNNTVLVTQEDQPTLIITLDKGKTSSATPVTASTAVLAPAATGTSLASTTNIAPASAVRTVNAASLPPPTDNHLMLQPVIDQNTTQAQGEYRKIDGFISEQKFNAAQRLISSLPKSERNSVQGVMLRAKLLQATGKQEQALDLLQNYPIQNPPADYYALLAALLEFNGQHVRAMEIYQKLVNYWPRNVDWWLGLGISAFHSKNDDTAIDAFNHVLTFEDVNPEVIQYVRSRLAELRIAS